MLPLVWSDEAQSDLLAIVRYVAERNTVAATRLGHSIKQSTEQLPRTPTFSKPANGCLAAARSSPIPITS